MNNTAKNSLLIIVAIFALFTFIFLGLVVYLNSSKQEQLTNSFTEDDLKVIAAGMTFTDEGLETFLYQSPLFDFQVEINTLKYNFSEKSNGLNVFPFSLNNNIYISVTVDTPVQKDTSLDKEVAKFTSYIQSYAGGTIFSSEDISLDNTPAKKILFSRKSFSNKLQNGLLVISFNNDRIYQLEYTVFSETALTGNELDSFTNSFKFIDSSKVNASAKYYSSFWGYGFEYNARFWQLDSTSGNSVFLNKRSHDLEDKERANISMSSLLVSRQDLLGKEISYLDQAAEERITTIKNSPSNKGFKITNQEEIQLGKRRAKLIEYQTDASNSLDSAFHKLYLVLHFNNLTSISLDYNQQDGTAPVELDKILANLTIDEPSTGNVKGTTSAANVEEKIALLAKPAVARIFNLTCAELSIPLAQNLPSSSGKSYRLCVAGYGSGFFVNSKGFVATNGHVAVFDDFNIANNAFNADLVLNLFKDFYLPKLISLDPRYAELTNLEIIELLKQNPDVLAEILDSIASLVYDKTLTLSNKRVELYVQKGTTPFIYDSNNYKLTNAADHYQAKLVDYDFDPQMTYKRFEKEPSSDVALLQLEDSGDFPALTLSKDLNTVNVGASMLVIGFPGVATDFGLLDKESQGEETITRGVVSSIKETTGGRKLIQTDASIYHGNSGGPGIDSNANVIGIASLSPGADSAGADFNFLRAITDLQALMSKNSVTNETGEVQKAWEEGVIAFFDGYFSKAVSALQKAKQLNPALVEADNLISVAQDKISQGLDKKEATGIFAFLENLSATEKTLFSVIAVLLGMFLFASLVIAVKLVGSKSQGGQMPPTQPPAPPMSVPPSVSPLKSVPPVAPAQMSPVTEIQNRIEISTQPGAVVDPKLPYINVNTGSVYPAAQPALNDQALPTHNQFNVPTEEPGANQIKG